MEKKTLVSFDFDGTLNDNFGGESNPHKQDIRDFCKLLLTQEQFEVYIITRRYDENGANLGLINEHVEVHEVAKELGIVKERVYFANRNSKLTHIIPLNIDVHIDDEHYDIHQINTYNGKCVGVSVYPELNPDNKSWREYMKELIGV
jgi:hypothetical protein